MREQQCPFPSLQATSCLLVASIISAAWLSTCWSQVPFTQDPAATLPAIEVTPESLKSLHQEVAGEYAIFTDPDRKHPAQLRPDPISEWVNPRRAGGQLGHVFVWMDGRTPVAMGGIFSFPWRGVMTDRRIVHEMHALAPEQLQVTRPGRESKWQPHAGLSRRTLPGVDGKVTSLARFKLVLRHITRRVSGHCIDPSGERWELRLQPTPLMVYPVQVGEQAVGFGAIIGMMGDVGSDFESGLLVEATTKNMDDKSSQTQWTYAPLRMTDMETHLSLDDQPIWNSVRSATDTSFFDTDHLYYRFQDRTIKLDSEN